MPNHSTSQSFYNGGQVYIVWILWFFMMLFFRWCFAQKRPLYQYNLVENENSAFFFQAHLPPEDARDMTHEEACVPVSFQMSCYADSRTEASIQVEDECITFSKDQIIRCIQSNRIVERDIATQISYFEITVASILEESRFSIGFASKPYPFFRLPGLDRYSIAYNSDTGHLSFNGSYFGDGSPLKVGDIVGCGIGNEFEGRQTFFFTLNGVRLPSDLETSDLIGRHFATLGAFGGCTLHVNWGSRPFMYSLQHDVNATSVLPSHMVANIQSLESARILHQPFQNPAPSPPPYTSDPNSESMDSTSESSLSPDSSPIRNHHSSDPISSSSSPAYHSVPTQPPA
eukprot:Sdes_comp21413_c0_seq1m20047